MTREEIIGRIEALIAEVSNTCRVNEEQAPSPANTSVSWSLLSIGASLRYLLTALTAPGEGLREAIQAFSDELDDWTNARPVPPVDFMTMQFGPKMVAAWDRVIRALAAPAPQEQAQCPSCDGLLDTAGCTCPAPPASAPEGGGA